MISGSEKNVLLVSILPKNMTDNEALKDLKELKSLVEAYGGVVRDLVVQRREVHDKGMYIGRGKLSEVSEVIKEEKITIIVLNGIIKPGQIYDIYNALIKHNPQIKVWDRVDLILEIFAVHAHTAEAKLQIELASMRHMGPRIYGMGFVMSRQGGGIGTLGVGETNTELMKRHWREQVKKIKDKLQKHALDRQRQLERRSRVGLKTISIIGYTNAGKTSLFNALSGKKNIVQNALFVTLDSSVSKVFLTKTNKEIILSDTIGFIRDLPMDLIDAFKSTLLESIHADLLLLIIDASDEDMEKKIKVVEDILYSMNLGHKKRIYVFNKMDATSGISKQTIEKDYEHFCPQFISVKNGEGLEQLLDSIAQSIENDNHTTRIQSKRIHIE